MRLDRNQRGSLGVPIGIFAALEGHAMNPGFFSEQALGDAGHLQRGSQSFDCVRNHGAQKSIFHYAIQVPNHTGTCERPSKRRSMERTSDQKREILRSFINQRGVKIARWAKELGVDKNSIYNFLNGHSQALDLRTYAKLARSASVPVWQISGDEPETPQVSGIPVVGEVQAGIFAAVTNWDEATWGYIDVPVPDRFKTKARALMVRGHSMNLDYRDGSMVVYVDMLDLRSPADGDHVIVHRKRHDGAIEATVKEMRIIEGKAWLFPKSDRPEFQAPIDPEAVDPKIASVEIIGIVIGDYRARVL